MTFWDKTFITAGFRKT